MKKAMVLCGIVPHINLLNKLKSRGYYTILADMNPEAPAVSYADAFLPISAFDKDAITEAAKQEAVELVISTCSDQANAVCCYVGEKLSLPIPYSYEVSLDVTDKTKMKHIMWDNDIPTSRYVYVDSVTDIEKISLNYPLMIKPADSYSANGVKRVFNEKELAQYLPDAFCFSRNGKAIVEEFIEGTEISAYSVIINGKAHVIMTQERISAFDGKDNVIKCYAAHAPARISEPATERAEEILTKIASAFRLDNTPLFFQGIVRGDDISVIEFAPRVGGGISSTTMMLATGYDIIDATIDSFLGKEISFDKWHEMEAVYAVNQLYGCDGIFDHMSGEEKLLEEKTIDLISYYRKQGAKVDSSRASSSRIAVIVAHGENDEQVCEKIACAIHSMEAYDANGRRMLRKDLYIKE